MKKLYLSAMIPFCIYGQNLNQLIDASLQNQIIQSSTYNIESTKLQYKSTQNAYLPKLTVGGYYSNTNEETMTVPDSSIVAYANLNYVVYDGGAKDHRFKSFESTIKSTEKSLNSLKNQIALQVTTYYFNYLSLVSQKEAKQKEIETLSAQQKRLQKFFEVGTTTSDEIDKIVSRVQTANVTLHEIELQIQTILHNLEYLTATQVDISDGSTVKEFISKEKLLRSDIIALEHQMDSIKQTANVTNSSNYPTISLDNTLYYYDMNYDNATYQSATIDSQNIFKINFAWKLYDFGSSSDAYKSVYKQYQALKSSYEYEKNKASVDLKLALKSYDIAKLKIASAKAGLKAANSTYETIEKKYKNGLVENVAYLEALSEKYGAISLLKAAQFDLEIKKVNIIYHSGENIWEYVK